MDIGTVESSVSLFDDFSHFMNIRNKLHIIERVSEHQSLGAFVKTIFFSIYIINIWIPELLFKILFMFVFQVLKAILARKGVYLSGFLPNLKYWKASLYWSMKTLFPGSLWFINATSFVELNENHCVVDFSWLFN